MVADVFGIPRYFAKSLITAAFAWPLAAISRTYTINEPSSRGSTRGPLREFGLMITVKRMHLLYDDNAHLLDSLSLTIKSQAGVITSYRCDNPLCYPLNEVSFNRGIMDIIIVSRNKKASNIDTVSDAKVSATEEQPSSAILSVQNLVKEYKIGRQKIRALNGISLDINAGEFIAIVGASGSGKSTLLQMLGGLDKPTSGTIAIDGKTLNKMSDCRLSIFRNQTIGFVFQSFYLQPFLSLQRNIEVAAMPGRMKRAERRERAKRLASAVGLAERLSHKPKELSGGQIQRAAIARALLNQPKIILADEPTGNLDSENSREIIALFRHLQQKLGTTVIIATHDQEIAAQADRIITVKDGALV
jgi:ABC-type lipoprotein export system ATPase subunit